MSGGHFNYDQSRILEMVEKIEYKIEMQGKKNKYGYTYETFEPEILQRMKEGIEALKKAYVYAQRIDWYLSCDDSEESFLKRLTEDLKNL